MKITASAVGLIDYTGTSEIGPRELLRIFDGEIAARDSAIETRIVGVISTFNVVSIADLVSIPSAAVQFSASLMYAINERE